jgi:diketogulonate reductase-like aldo/keto reductase
MQGNDRSHEPTSRRASLRLLGAATLAGWLGRGGDAARAQVPRTSPSAASAVPPSAAPSPETSKSRTPDVQGRMLLRPIPGKGETLPVIGLGTWQSFDVGDDPEGLAGARESLRLFVEAGGRTIDSSPMYGSSESVVGRLATEIGAQNQLFVATKVWTTGRSEGVEQMQTSASRLRRERIDLMQIHNLVDWRTHLRTLRDWKAEGRIRYWGFTHYTVGSHRELAALIRSERPDFVQFNYSIVTRDAERELLPVAADHNTAVLINRPFESGELFGRVRNKPLPGWSTEIECSSWAQFFLKFIVSHPAVTCAIPPTREPRHLIDNMAAGVGRLPDSRQRESMAAYMRSL